MLGLDVKTSIPYPFLLLLFLDVLNDAHLFFYNYKETILNKRKY